MAFKLLAHCNGADGSTSFPDSGDTGHTITANGHCQVDTAQSKFGGASALFDGTGDYLSVASHSDFGFGTGDFTIDFWLRLNSFASPVDLFVWGTSDIQCRFNLHTSGGGRLDVFFGGTGGNSVNHTFSTGTWYHIACTRASGTVKVFVDGTQKDSFTASGSISTAAIRFGIYHDGSTFPLNGWMDEIAIRNEAIWTSGFTPPTEAYGASGQPAFARRWDRKPGGAIYTPSYFR